MMARHRLTSSDALRSGEMVGLRANDHKILLLCIDGCLHAYADRCAHLGLPLSRGTLDGTTLTCAAHHFQYDASSGCGINPANVRLKRYPVVVDAGDVFVEIDEEGAVR